MKLNRVNSAIDRNERNKINDNFDIIERGFGKTALDAQYAVETSDEAKQKAESTQIQLNTIVIEGDSSVEAAQARVSVDDTVYTTLKERLDEENTKVTQQLAQNEARIKDGDVSVSFFGVNGDNTTETTSLQNAIDYCHENGLTLNLGGLTIRTDSIVIKCEMVGTRATILFNEGHGFTNFELDGSKRYHIRRLYGITFESDKERYWSKEHAGESFVEGILKSEVKRMYGQRVFIGNKTTTPNNILANDPNEQQNGTGFWNKNYQQWINADDITFGSLSSQYNDLATKNDTNTLSLQEDNASIVNCRFVGFSVGLTLRGTYKLDFKNNTFARCHMGVACLDGALLPGNLSSVNSKCTTIRFNKNIFFDISKVGIYGYSFLQSTVDDNIFQPCKLGISIFYGAQNTITRNYFEVCHCGGVFLTTGCFDNIWDENYCNAAYTTYQVRLHGGNKNKYTNARTNKAFFIDTSVTKNCDFDDTFDVSNALTGTNIGAFFVNGNSQSRNKTKFAVIKITGNGGTAIVKELKRTNRPVNEMPTFVASQRGLSFNGNEEILSVEHLSVSNNHKFITYYDIANTGTDRVVYVDKFVDGSIVYDDLREQGQVNVLKVTFLDGMSIT